MTEAVVSVIIPVYNGERYIRHAIECVLGQTYHNWELILVDDASTDATSHICQEYAIMPNIRYLRNKSRSGVSAARNAGMKAAGGKYIVFMDADDTMEEVSLKIRVDLMEVHKLDMGVFNYRIIIEGKEPEKRNLISLGEFDTAGFLKRISDFQTGINLGIDCVWDKIFRTDIIRENKLYFREDWHMTEDSLFCLGYIDACSGFIEVSDICVLDYFIRKDNENSLSLKFHNGEFEHTFNVTRAYFDLLGKLLKKNMLFTEEIREGFYHGYINRVIGDIYNYIKVGGHREQLKRIFETNEFLAGMEIYRCRNAREDSGIIEVLRQKDVDKLYSYVEARLKMDENRGGKP